MIKKFTVKHTFYFSVFTITVSVIALLFGNKIGSSNELIISFICLFLILSVGISHGQWIIIRRINYWRFIKKKNKSIFYILYLSISVMIILLWSLYPLVTLLMFLIIASYHFGRRGYCILASR